MSWKFYNVWPKDYKNVYNFNAIERQICPGQKLKIPTIFKFTITSEVPAVRNTKINVYCFELENWHIVFLYFDIYEPIKSMHKLSIMVNIFQAKPFPSQTELGDIIYVRVG